jgi:hypothetical protein
MGTWLTAHRTAARVVATIVVFIVWFVLWRVSPHFADAQRAHSPDGFNQSKVRWGLAVDVVFMAAYGAWFLAAFWPIEDPRHSGHRHPAALAGLFLVAGGVIADLVEDGYLFAATGAERSAALRDLAVMRSAGLVKWALLGTAALILVVLVLRHSSWRHVRPGLSTTRPIRDPQPPAGHDPWDPPPKGAESRVGVCLSGGGIRSAAFCLGALQALRERGKLARASYLSAASGGGYLAAGWAVSDAAPPAKPPRWDPGSPEERWFRDHSSYLVPDLKRGVAGIYRLLAGVIVNLLVIGLVLFAVARPIGWAMYALHDDLRAKGPAVLIRDSVGAMEVAPTSLLGSVDNDGAQAPIRRYAVTLAPAAGNEACFDLPPYKSGEREVCVNVRQVEGKAGVVEVQGGRGKVVTQPRVEITPPELGPPCPDKPCRKVREAAVIAEQPTLDLADALVVDGQDPAVGQFKVEQQPRVSVTTGLGAVSYPSYPWWMWEIVGGLLGGALLLALAVMSLRLRDRRADVVRTLAQALAGAGAVAFVVMIGLPWLVVWLPRTLNSLVSPSTKSASGSGLQNYLVPGAGTVALIIAAARQYLTASKGKAGAGGGPSTSWFAKIRGALSKKSTQLKWYELSPDKVLLAVFWCVALVVSFVNVLQFASANGPKGELMGFAFVRDSLPDWLFLPDGVKFVLALAALALFAWMADAQSWSLYPFYKTRLSSAYLLERTEEGRAEAIPYKVLLPFTKLRTPDHGPQLIACCAVNLSEYGVVPPGRRAASFTFSSTEIGGPLVGYAKPEEYEALPLNRRRDVTVASAMAISGAAFSPAMGKFNLGPKAPLLALANLRLGVWIPHPCRVREAKAAEWDWRRFRRPNWWWYLKELTNKYGFNRRYVYVSDGGHWDNLGLVELLRRGCTEIYCMSGAGDGSLSFGTIGEAIALAREELGVEITLDPSSLRPSTVEPNPSPARELRREGAKDKAVPYAAASAVRGTFQFPDGADGTPGAKGVLYYVEADLTVDMPFDVHSFAEGETVFPDDSTGDQVFGHRQFESYRALGYHQAEVAADLP